MVEGNGRAVSTGRFVVAEDDVGAPVGMPAADDWPQCDVEQQLVVVITRVDGADKADEWVVVAWVGFS